MLDFSRALCAVPNARFGSAGLEVPILMDRLLCFGDEEALDQCRFSGWEENSCNHRDDAGLICYPGKKVVSHGHVRLCGF